jgi:hypothetical protein
VSPFEITDVVVAAEATVSSAGAAVTVIVIV